jgi:hypothetical protein
MTRELAQLIRQSRPMTEGEREEQARNFVAGNIGLENPRVTRTLVDRVADAMGRPRPHPSSR